VVGVTLGLDKRREGVCGGGHLGEWVLTLGKFVENQFVRRAGL